nr:cobalamin-dependent protein [Desulfitobacterium hafniense]
PAGGAGSFAMKDWAAGLCFSFQASAFGLAPVINLGVDISPEKFVEAIKEHNPDVVAMSALLTTTMTSMEDTIDMLVETGLRDKVKVIVGGAPVSQDFADTIGADGYAPDAASAADLCKSLIAK